MTGYIPNGQRVRLRTPHTPYAMVPLPFGVPAPVRGGTSSTRAQTGNTVSTVLLGNTPSSWEARPLVLPDLGVPAWPIESSPDPQVFYRFACCAKATYDSCARYRLFWASLPHLPRTMLLIQRPQELCPGFITLSLLTNMLTLIHPTSSQTTSWHRGLCRYIAP